jgi:hypothetical protein
MHNRAMVPITRRVERAIFDFALSGLTVYGLSVHDCPQLGCLGHGTGRLDLFLDGLKFF